MALIVDPATLFANHYAFLVGIDNYDDPHFTGLGAYADAEAIYNALLEIGYQPENLQLVPQENTSLDALLNEIDEFQKRARTSRRRTPPSLPEVVVFWAGHGVPGNHTSYLITRDSAHGRPENSAISLQLITEHFKKLFPASLTMFFDVCHSIPRDRDDLVSDPSNLILGPMRDTVRGNAQPWSFVGVSTYAYEHLTMAAQGHGRTLQRGILATVLERKITGEPCDEQDEPCSDADFIVSVERLIANLEEPVDRRTRRLGVSERVVVLRDHGPNRISKPIGLNVKLFETARLAEEQLPQQVALLAKVILDEDRSGTWSITEFGDAMVTLLRRLTRRKLSREDFLGNERALFLYEILKFRNDDFLKSYVGFLLYCRQEAGHDVIAKEILDALYNHLVWGGSPGALEEFLRPRYEIFPRRKALPWSCGIRALRGEDQDGYAAIIYEGAPVTPLANEASRTFVTTSPLQKYARLEIYHRGDRAALTIKDAQHCDVKNWRIGEFARELPIGTRVWVRMGPDEGNCSTGCGSSAARSYVPMKILLGREGCKEHDWEGHWHLELGRGGGRLGTGGGPDPILPWVSGLEALIDECLRWLGAWANSSEEEERTRPIVTWLYYAERLTRERDESELRHTLEMLIADLREDSTRSALRLSAALRMTTSASTNLDPPSVTDAENRAGNFQEISLEVSREALIHYERWRTDTRLEGRTSEGLRKAEILAVLLDAVLTERRLDLVTARVVEIVAVGPGEFPEKLGSVVAAGYATQAHDVSVARSSATVFGLAVTNFLETEESGLRPTQRQALRRGVQSVTRASEEGEIEDALRELFTLLRETIGLSLGTSLIAREFSEVTRLESSSEFDDLMVQLRRDENADTRQSAEAMYRLLYRLYRSGLRRGENLPETGMALLHGLEILLWPNYAAMAMLPLTTAGVTRSISLQLSRAVMDPDQGNLADILDGDVSVEQLVKNMSFVEQARRAKRAWHGWEPAMKKLTSRVQTSRNESQRNEPEASKAEVGEPHDLMLLAIPLGESYRV